MLQLNFTVDLDFLWDHLSPKVRDTLPIVVVHGHRFSESIAAIQNQALSRPNIRLAQPKLSNRFGVHHTKAMVLFYRGKQPTAQIVIMTANMCRTDWEDMTQGVYRTPRCPLKSDTHRSMSAWQDTLIGSEFGSPFERDMINYLNAYHLSVLDDTCKKMRQYNWSECKAILVGSVPGYHRGPDFNLWGLERLATVLQHHVSLPSACQKQSEVIAQCSSVANLPQSWFQDDFRRCVSHASNVSEAQPPLLRFIYPTVNNVAQRHNINAMSTEAKHAIVLLASSLVLIFFAWSKPYTTNAKTGWTTTCANGAAKKLVGKN